MFQTFLNQYVANFSFSYFRTNCILLTQSVLHQSSQQQFSNRGAELTIEAVVVHPNYIISFTPLQYSAK